MDWNIFGSAISGAIVGGLFTLLGGQYQVYLSTKKEKKENVRQMKIEVLSKLMANKPALSTSAIRPLYEKDFYNAMNQISITFSDNKKVIELYEKFWKHRNSKEQQISSMSNEMFYELIKSMYEDLSTVGNEKMEAPNYDLFIKTFG